MRFILGFIPDKETMAIYIQAAQQLFLSIHESYLLSENSLPHITVCQFESNHDKDTKIIWEQIDTLKISSFSPQLQGLSFIKGVGNRKGYYWAEVSVARDQEIMRAHHLATEIVQSNGCSCLNDSGDLFIPKPNQSAKISPNLAGSFGRFFLGLYPPTG